MGLNDMPNEPSQTQREDNNSLFVLHHNCLLLCNGIVGRDTREPMSLASFCCTAVLRLDYQNTLRGRESAGKVLNHWESMGGLGRMKSLQT